MKSLVRAYRKYDPAAKSSLEILLFYPGIKAILLHRMAHYFFLRGHTLMARSICEFNRFLTGIEIHPGARIGEDVVIDHGMGVVIGETAVVGNNVIMYQGVTLGGTSLSPVKRHPTVGDRVVIGAGAKLLGNILIGPDARIGANSVVVESVPASAVVVGVPGRVLSRKELELFFHDFSI